MKNTFGNAFQVTIFGESHGDGIGIIIDGLPAGIALDFAFIQQQIKKRQPKEKISTKRHEEDAIEIVSGFFENHTTGSPLCILIKNNQHNSKDYEALRYLLRPSHADYSAYAKYNGYQDFRGGGHFSGRITAPLVVAGAIALQILKSYDIQIATHILQCYDIEDESFASDEEVLQKQIQNINNHALPVVKEETTQKMMQCIQEKALQLNSVGGVVESVILGVPAGLGEPFFDSLESTLSHLLFSIPSIKGVEFGLGFAFANKTGKEVNDCFYYEQGIKTKTNHNGGINGGISNGMPIHIKAVVKPTASIFQKQETVNIKTKENTTLEIKGRHDPSILPRVCVVVDSVLAIGILDAYMQYAMYQQLSKK